MAIFRKKHEEGSVDEDRMESSIYEEETSTVPKVKTMSKGRRMSRFICGYPTSKQILAEDNMVSAPPHKMVSASPHNMVSAPRHKGSRSSSSSSSTSSSSGSGDRRDDRQNSFNGKSSVGDRQHYMDDNSLIASIPPPAAESAFNGPPRFDWIDIEYHAATRVQKIFRRYLVLQEMEHAGLTTSYIRNRKRERKARAYFSSSIDDRVSDLGFGCCSMNLALGNGDLEIADTIAYEDFQRKQYQEKKNSRKEREEFLSQSYLEQKGINSKYDELEQTKFRDESILREPSLCSL